MLAILLILKLVVVVSIHCDLFFFNFLSSFFFIQVNAIVDTSDLDFGIELDRVDFLAIDRHRDILHFTIYERLAALLYFFLSRWVQSVHISHQVLRVRSDTRLVERDYVFVDGPVAAIGRVDARGGLVLILHVFSEASLLSVLLMRLAHKDHAGEDDEDEDNIAPLVVCCHEETKHAMNGTLNHLILTVEA